MEFKKYILSLRKFRVFHRLLGTTLALLLFISACTGVLLSLKKDVDVIQPPTQRGQSTQLNTWKPLSELSLLAKEALLTKQPAEKGNAIDRLDVRPDKGIVKVLFESGNWEVQLDGETGEVLSVAKRYSDWIESLHDGSIIGDFFKLFSMNFLGIGTILLICTGLWLWYGPKLIRRIKRRRD